jgi:sodium/potassium-transporting ATPase subunit beta
MAKANDTAKPAEQPQFQFAQKPEELSGWEGFKKFLWNSEKQEFMGRTGCSWFKIGLFYIVYYAFLAGFFTLMLLIFFETLDMKQPKWQGANGIIGANPGMGFRPTPPDSNLDSTLIWFRHGDIKEGTGNWQGWVDRLNKFLEAYQKVDKKPSSNQIECSYKPEVLPGENQICKVQSEEMMTAPCNNDTAYGFKAGTPCILIKLNRIYGWEPEPYESKEDIPEDAPKSLGESIDAMIAKDSDKEVLVGKMVWFTCEGENPADKENLGEIDYYPYPGIPIYYFPYKNQEKYLSPAVFAHLKNPKKGVLISIACKAWAKNIEHENQDRVGLTHFEIMID